MIKEDLSGATAIYFTFDVEFEFTQQLNVLLKDICHSYKYKSVTYITRITKILVARLVHVCISRLYRRMCRVIRV